VTHGPLANSFVILLYINLEGSLRFKESIILVKYVIHERSCVDFLLMSLVI
jgi:hypothetical protein